MTFIDAPALSGPATAHFCTHFFCDEGDGFQNVWNLWWFNHAVGSGQGVYFTRLLFAPEGIDLTAQTMVPFNGMVARVLLRFTSLVVAHNLLLIWGFVASGVTAFWLAFHVSHHFRGALIAGGIFTFSSYHFAHAEGHMQLVAMEFIPLFMLCFVQLLEKPSILRAVVAAAVLYLVRLCDLYYLVFSILAASVSLGFILARAKNMRLVIQKPLAVPLACFAVLTAASSGVILVKLLILNFLDPLRGSHSSYEFAMDLFAPWIPGGHWYFSEWTHIYWSKLKGNINESSVYSVRSTNHIFNFNLSHVKMLP